MTRANIIRPIISPPWHCVQTYHNQEKIAETNLRAQGFDTLFPSCYYQNSFQKMFPGYGFVRFDPIKDNWRPIHNTRGVKHLFSMTSAKPATIPNSIILAIVAQSQEIDPSLVIENERIPLGASVTPISGPFKGFAGIVTQTAAKRIQMLISIFGRESSVEINADQVKRTGK